jgi:hypothetical protein
LEPRKYYKDTESGFSVHIICEVDTFIFGHVLIGETMDSDLVPFNPVIMPQIAEGLVEISREEFEGKFEKVKPDVKK